MVQTLLAILSISVIIAVPASMVVLSLKAGRPYLKELFSEKAVLIRYFAVMFILMPAIALLFYFFDVSHPEIWIALLVISISPASPGMIKGITKLGGDESMSIAWLITAILISLVMLPVNLLIIERILNVNIDIGIDDVAIKLFFMFLLPILIGFLISKYLSGYASSVSKILGLISGIASIVMIVCLLIIAVPVLIKKGIIDFSLILLFQIIALVISLLMDFSRKKRGPILAYSVVLRLPAAALVLAAINGKTQIYAPEIISFVIIGVLVMAVYKKLFHGKEKSK